jgi:hypothetical protein
MSTLVHRQTLLALLAGDCLLGRYRHFFSRCSHLSVTTLCHSTVRCWQVTAFSVGADISSRAVPTCQSQLLGRYRHSFSRCSISYSWHFDTFTASSNTVKSKMLGVLFVCWSLSVTLLFCVGHCLSHFCVLATVRHTFVCWPLSVTLLCVGHCPSLFCVLTTVRHTCEDCQTVSL